MSKWIRILPTLCLLIGIHEHAMATNACAQKMLAYLGKLLPLHIPMLIPRRCLTSYEKIAVNFQ